MRLCSEVLKPHHYALKRAGAAVRERAEGGNPLPRSVFVAFWELLCVEPHVECCGDRERVENPWLPH